MDDVLVSFCPAFIFLCSTPSMSLAWVDRLKMLLYAQLEPGHRDIGSRTWLGYLLLWFLLYQISLLSCDLLKATSAL